MLTDLPNVLTLSRIAAIPMLVVLIALHQPGADLAACILFSAAAITDYFDGKLARSRRQQSDLGRMLDPIADKLLVGAALMMLVGKGRLSDWGLYPAIVIMLREILVSGLREYLAGIRIGLPVTRLAKWKTGFQMGALGTLLAGNSTRDPAAPVVSSRVGNRRGDAVGRGSADHDHRLGLPDRRAASRDRPCSGRGGSQAAVKVLGIVGWSGSGKTSLLEMLLPRLRARGLSVSTIKHAHHGFDMDRPGKDSYRHRQAGAQEVLVSTAARWALLHEVSGPEPGLPDLLARLAPVDLVLVEGFKTHSFAKLEVHRPALGKPPIWPVEAGVVAVASDSPIEVGARALLPLNQPDTIAKWVGEQWQRFIAVA